MINNYFINSFLVFFVSFLTYPNKQISYLKNITSIRKTFKARKRELDIPPKLRQIILNIAYKYAYITKIIIWKEGVYCEEGTNNNLRFMSLYGKYFFRLSN